MHRVILEIAVSTRSLVRVRRSCNPRMYAVGVKSSYHYRDRVAIGVRVNTLMHSYSTRTVQYIGTYNILAFCSQDRQRHARWACSPWGTWRASGCCARSPSCRSSAGPCRPAPWRPPHTARTRSGADLWATWAKQDTRAPRYQYSIPVYLFCSVHS